MSMCVNTIAWTVVIVVAITVVGVLAGRFFRFADDDTPVKEDQ